MSKKIALTRIWQIVLLCTCTLLWSCTLAPKYYRPEAPIPVAYGYGDKENAELVNLAWQDFFKDANMQRCIELALENNRDLRVALLNIEKTRQMYRIKNADLLPTINATGTHTSQLVPESMSQTGQSTITRQYTASLGFSGFELDLFGRLRSLSNQALETFYSVELDAQTSRLSLMAEVAAMYLQLVADQELLDITLATYENRKQQLELVARKLESGTASELSYNQAKVSFEEARIYLAQYQAKVGQGRNYLALLLGTGLPEDLEVPRRLADVAPLQDLPTGLPSSVLERRPDILSAEHRLKAANANIGAARANFFPNISLTGSFGSMSLEYNELFKASSETWTFAPTIYLPIFDTGRNIAMLGVSNAEKEIAVAGYEKTIQMAFREVADSLVQREYIVEQLDAETQRYLAAKQTFTLAEHRYNVGIDNMLTLLDAQRTLYTAEQSYINTRLLREGNALTIYKAIGGGWQAQKSNN